MNLLLLKDEDFLEDGTARLRGRRALHAREVLRAQAGQALRVGRWGGRMGTGQVLESSHAELRLQVQLDQEPPARPGFDLVLAVPRPKALKKIVPAAASLGVDRLVLVNAARVERSYFDSKALAPAFLDELISLGLEQARDTRPPEVLVRERFRPFVEDELDGLLGPSVRRVAHPAAAGPLEVAKSPTPRSALAVGPEGGWVPFELQLLEARGFVPFSLGPRILRVETAVPLVVGQLLALRRT